MCVNNPCLTCGACCAFFRVSFYWAEVDDASGTVPARLTEPATPHLCCMRGTNQKSPRCIALRGTPGKAVSCAIYANRPGTCREFEPFNAQGLPDEACCRARAHYGLAPLTAIAPSPEVLAGRNQGTIAR
ncbi:MULTISPECIES: YkgJ family cysteine cluster protein [Tenebrionibacter/Tenebrionicola group]|jgi:Fe-S-cluster containining protein|uniref:YkgJ family cysteine cluster protein n=2 Tax=Tenebrionibacter/Tenebrionicola group TaxID=2969848 RepID=A0A8K0V2H4_9ENTR|nr:MULTISPECIES: YkgJ family cysteine cluster protein [Tenebrionibacter/Tenebrionicola group]MBK4713930.1 YkgJ family cysteine cluster protein [Tenebrionibacter intestinalis]MBV4411459.1 YkgJ family cysteine cluster protein [Tenebrionicola larvae]MBV5096396.1 YkgJ family cysteine cluster protein [Tenebrionicola larvae]